MKPANTRMLTLCRSLLLTDNNINRVTNDTSYISDFNGNTLSSRAYWASEVADLPFLGMPLDACSSTICPAVAGERQIYSVILPISKKFPVVSHFLDLKLPQFHFSNISKKCDTFVSLTRNTRKNLNCYLRFSFFFHVAANVRTEVEVMEREQWTVLFHVPDQIAEVRP